MKFNFTINIEKKHLIMFSVFLLLLVSIFTYSENVNEYLPWHNLQQIARGEGDLSSVDSNKDGYIDLANNATYAFDADKLDGYNASELMGGSGGGVPAGTIAAFNLESCPNGWQPADGLDGRPDLRGMFIRGLNSFDGGLTARSDGKQDPNSTRELGSFQNEEIGPHNHYVPYVHTTGGTLTGLADIRPSRVEVIDGFNTYENSGIETRPKNLAFIYCIKENGETQEDFSLLTDTGSQIKVNDNKPLYVKNEKVVTESEILELAQTIVTGEHTFKSCTDAGGEVYEFEEEEYYVCKFDGNSCPTHWAQYENWSTTTSVSLNYCPNKASTYCYSDTHDFANIPPESITNSFGTVRYSNIIEIGCY